MSNSVKLILIVVVVLAGFVGLGVWLNSMSKPTARINPDIQGEALLARDNSHMTGAKTAKVTVVEFADLECPYCAEYNPAVMEVVNKYRDNPEFNFVYRHFPLSQHQHALAAAAAVEAANEQGKFWEMKDLLYQNQKDWSGSITVTDKFISYADTLKLDVPRFEQDLKSGKYNDFISQDAKDGEALGVNSTPTFYVNGEKLQSHLQLDAKISSLLSAN